MLGVFSFVWELFLSSLEVSFCSKLKHAFRIFITKMVFLESTFGVMSLSMTSNWHLYTLPFHLRNVVNVPIGLIHDLSKFWSTLEEGVNLASGNNFWKVFLFIALTSEPVSSLSGSFLIYGSSFHSTSKLYDQSL